jgi:endonuclease/exonuclease/phosphatase family metal-dependent hydrolase
MSAFLWAFCITAVAVVAIRYSTTLRYRPWKRLQEAVLGPVHNAVARPVPLPASLRLLSHNVWCHYPATLLSPKDGVQSGWDFLGRLRALADHVEGGGYDVVLLQELFIMKAWLVGTTRNFEYFLDRMRKAGLVHCTDPTASLHGDRLWGQNSGVVIFSRHRVHSCRNVDFAFTSEGNNTKGFVAVTVESSSGMLRFVCAHLDSRSLTSQQRQVQQLVEQVDAWDRTDPCVATTVCADFNICRHGFDDGAQYRFLAAQMSRTGLSDLYAPSEEPGTSDGGRTTVDHVFINRGTCTPLHREVVVVANDAGLTASDHYGIAATLQFSQ